MYDLKNQIRRSSRYTMKQKGTTPIIKKKISRRKKGGVLSSFGKYTLAAFAQVQKDTTTYAIYLKGFEFEEITFREENSMYYIDLSDDINSKIDSEQIKDLQTNLREKVTDNTIFRLTKKDKSIQIFPPQGNAVEIVIDKLIDMGLVFISSEKYKERLSNWWSSADMWKDGWETSISGDLFVMTLDNFSITFDLFSITIVGMVTKFLLNRAEFDIQKKTLIAPTTPYTKELQFLAFIQRMTELNTYLNILKSNSITIDTFDKEKLQCTTPDKFVFYFFPNVMAHTRSCIEFPNLYNSHFDRSIHNILKGSLEERRYGHELKITDTYIRITLSTLPSGLDYTEYRNEKIDKFSEDFKSFLLKYKILKDMESILFVKPTTSLEVSQALIAHFKTTLINDRGQLLFQRDDSDPYYYTIERQAGTDSRRIRVKAFIEQNSTTAIRSFDFDLNYEKPGDFNKLSADIDVGSFSSYQDMTHKSPLYDDDCYDDGYYDDDHDYETGIEFWITICDTSKFNDDDYSDTSEFNVDDDDDYSDTSEINVGPILYVVINKEGLYYTCQDGKKKLDLNNTDWRKPRSTNSSSDDGISKPPIRVQLRNRNDTGGTTIILPSYCVIETIEGKKYLTDRNMGISLIISDTRTSEDTKIMYQKMYDFLFGNTVAPPIPALETVVQYQLSAY